MGTTKRTHRSLDLLAVLVFSGCLVGISGNIVEKHADEIQNILLKFTSLIKMEKPGQADNGTGNPVVCFPIGEIDLIKDYLVNETSYPFDIQFSLNCSELDTLKAKLIVLEIGFKKVINVPISSIDYRYLKSNFENKILIFNNLLDNSRNKTSGETLQILNRVHADFRVQSEAIERILRKIESEQKSLNDEGVESTIKKLQKGSLAKAIAVFQNITDRDIQFVRIVAAVNASGASFENMFQLVAQLPTQSRLNAYEIIYSELKKNNGTMDHRIWILATAIKDFVGVHGKRDGHLNDVIVNELKVRIRNTRANELITFFNDRGAEAIVTVMYVAPILIRTIYYEIGKNAKSFLSVLVGLKSIRHRLALIKEFVSMLKATEKKYCEDLPLLVYELIKLRSIREPNDEFLLKSAELSLPEELRDLMYDNLCIQNVDTNEYLHAGEPSYNSHNRYVYTAKTSELDDSFFWRVTFIENGTRLLIRNNKYKEDIYLMDEGDREKDHILLSWILIPNWLNYDEKSKFELRMVENGEFIIYNNYFGQLLYTKDEILIENNKRTVYSKNYDTGDSVDADSKWIVGVCKVYV